MTQEDQGTMQMRSVFPPPAPTVAAGTRPGVGRRLTYAIRGAASRFRATLVERWPRMRRQLPTDLLILTWLALAAQGFSAAWIMTDSVNTSLAIVVKGATPRRGELAVFAYQGRAVRDYYLEVPLTKLLLAMGLLTDTYGPKKGDGFVKYVVGLPGDQLLVQGQQALLRTPTGWVDVGPIKATSLHGAPLTPAKSQTIPEGYVYVWSPKLDALDSRYDEMGLVPRSAIVGKAVPLW